MSVKLARIKKNLSQSELSELTGIGINSIVKIEKDNFGSIKFDTLMKLSKFLEVPFEELFLKED